MLCKFPKFSSMIKISGGLKTYLYFLDFFWRCLDLVWDAKNICCKYIEVSRHMTNMFYDSASSRFDQLVRN